ncbi:MAG: hypothetical protein KC618_07935 [Candidatus Omnitrophica bacterium]|nr:hypothetical protein [Candidatus Omnitrophota bacterium]
MTSVWLLLLLIITAYYWSKETPNPILITVAVLAGLAAFIQAQNIILKTGWEAALASILAGGIFVASMFAMNLGHWYLNVHGLPVSHLFRATYVFWALVAIRFLWDIYYILTANVLYRGEPFPLVQFIQKTDGILILLGIFFGVLFPLGGNYFVKETLKLKNTQSATGILYVILVAVILGDLAFKYYLIKFGIAL